MSDPALFGMLGASAILEKVDSIVAKQRCTISEAFQSLEVDEVDRAASAEMPDAVREAWLAGQATARHRRWKAEREAARRPRTINALEHGRQAVVGAVSQPVDPKDRTNMQSGMTLSPQEFTVAQQLLVRMAQPLNADERKICASLGITEADYKTERDRELQGALQGTLQDWHAGMGAGLDADELKVCQVLGITPEDYAAEKARR
jgi:hypothetical protein